MDLGMSWIKSKVYDYVCPAAASVVAVGATAYGMPVLSGAAATFALSSSIKTAVVRVFESKAPGVVDEATKESIKLIKKFCHNTMLTTLGFASIDLSMAISKSAHDCNRNNYSAAACLKTDIISTIVLMGALPIIWQIIQVAKYLGREIREETQEAKLPEGFINISVPDKYKKVIEKYLFEQSKRIEDKKEKSKTEEKKND